jgi:hypothetical protein
MGVPSEVQGCSACREVAFAYFREVSATFEVRGVHPLRGRQGIVHTTELKLPAKCASAVRWPFLRPPWPWSVTRPVLRGSNSHSTLTGHPVLRTSEIASLPLRSHPRCPGRCFGRLSWDPRCSLPSTSLRTSSHEGVSTRVACRCHRQAGSVLVVSHHLNGFLRSKVAGLLHPAADPGVRRVSGLKRQGRQRL